MNEKQRNKHSKKSGFTLIEIILVVVIIGTLSVVFIRGIDFQGKTEAARIAAARIDIGNLSSALKLYEMMNGTYPDSLEGLLDSSKQGYPFLDPNIIPKSPWKKEYTYAEPGTHNTKFDVWCESANGVIVGNWPEESDE